MISRKFYAQRIWLFNCKTPLIKRRGGSSPRQVGRRKEGHHGVESQAQCEGRSLGSELAGAWKEKSEEAACSPGKQLRRQAVAPRDRWVTLVRAACFLIVHQAAVGGEGMPHPPPRDLTSQPL